MHKENKAYETKITWTITTDPAKLRLRVFIFSRTTLHPQLRAEIKKLWTDSAQL